MKKYEERKVKYVQEKECVKFVCDMCGAIATISEAMAESWSETGGMFHGELKSSHWIDGEDFSEDDIDLCPSCFRKIYEYIRTKRRGGDGRCNG